MKKGLLDKSRGALTKYIVKQLLESLAKKYAWTAVGPIGWLLSFFASKFVETLLDNTILGINLMLIKVNNDGDVKELLSLLEKAKEASEDERKGIENDLEKAAISLIKLGDARKL